MASSNRRSRGKRGSAGGRGLLRVAPEPTSDPTAESRPLDDGESGACLTTSARITVAVPGDEYEEYRRFRDAERSRISLDTDEDAAFISSTTPALADSPGRRLDDDEVPVNGPGDPKEVPQPLKADEQGEVVERERDEDPDRDPDEYFDQLRRTGGAAVQALPATPPGASPGSASIDTPPVRSPRRRGSRRDRAADAHTRMPRRSRRLYGVGLLVALAVAAVASAAVVLDGGRSGHRAAAVLHATRAGVATGSITRMLARDAGGITSVATDGAKAAQAHAAARAKAERARARAAKRERAKREERARAARARRKRQAAVAPLSTSTASTPTSTTSASTSSAPVTSGSSGSSSPSSTSSSQPAPARHPYGVGGLLSIGSSPSG